MTNSGSLEAVIEVPPRIRMLTPAPGWPPDGVSWTPATRPSIKSVGDVTRPTSASSTLIDVTDAVTSPRRWTP